MNFGGVRFRNLAASYKSRSGCVDFKGRMNAASYAEITLPLGQRASRRSPMSLNGIPSPVKPSGMPHVEEHRGPWGVIEPCVSRCLGAGDYAGEDGAVRSRGLRREDAWMRLQGREPRCPPLAAPTDVMPDGM